MKIIQRISKILALFVIYILCAYVYLTAKGFVVKDGDVSIKHITANDNAVERAVTMVPEMFDKVTSFVSKNKEAKNSQPTE